MLSNSAQVGYVFEPTLEEIKKMLTVLRNEKPVACQAVQFSGDEPTVRKEIINIIKMAHSMGFPHIQMASNGVNMANQKIWPPSSRKAV